MHRNKINGDVSWVRTVTDLDQSGHVKPCDGGLSQLFPSAPPRELCKKKKKGCMPRSVAAFHNSEDKKDNEKKECYLNSLGMNGNFVSPFLDEHLR